MVDTIAILLHENQFRIMNHERFSPSTLNLFQPPFIKVTGRSGFKAVNNPTVDEKQKYGYMPRITLHKVIRQGGYQIFLKIEFSAPKLLYGNNFDEIDDLDFSKLVQTLHRRLFMMGVSVPNPNDIKIADIASIHYCKNIILTDYSTPSLIINELSKANISKLKDVNSTDYRNEGHAFKFHTNNFEVIFYDKLADLKQAKKSEKRAIEKDSYGQLGLFDQPHLKKPFEVLRMEIRLGDRKKIKQILAQNNFSTDVLSLKYLFSKSIAKTLLLSMLNELENSHLPALRFNLTNEELFAQVLMQNPAKKYKETLAIFGSMTLIKEIGVRKFRKATEKFGATNWHRMNKKLKEFQPNTTVNYLTKLRSDIKSFDKVELESYKDKM